MTFAELIKWLEENKDKVFEFSFGTYWVQIPFGLVGDVISKVYEYVLREKQNEQVNISD